jgi:uncharacterized repeat protein (TIGR03803 family)
MHILQRKFLAVGLSEWRRACVVILLCATTTIACPAQTFTTLVNFDFSNGGQPFLTSLVQGTDGNLYGTTPVGGSNGPFGTVFRITPEGDLTTLHSFDGSPTEGAFSTAGLVLTPDGNFYGTTEEGGAANAGTVFKIMPDGTLTTLHSFCAQPGCTDGYQPDGALVQGNNGSLYGTTQIGGANNHGEVFRITPSGKLTTLYNFCALTNCADGGYPNTALVHTVNGNFYGTNSATVFKITPSGKLTTLHTFGGTDGTGVVVGLVQASDGNFYGTASAGGPNGHNDGTVFKITPQGVLTTLYNFSGPDGISPESGLVQATDGYLYGTTWLGGTHNSGTLFKISPAGQLTTLYNFCAQPGCTDGARPSGRLFQATNGNLYGTTWGGGTSDEGTIFSLSVGLSPFVELLVTSGRAGTLVVILGTNLMGATNVSFNGTAAPFTVVSRSEITTTVPPDAKTGTVYVTIPSGILKSNLPFRVLPQITGFTPTSGAAGTSVTITGSGFIGATRVTFGGVKAISYTVDSGTQITATVPTGAKTGNIAVATPGGSASKGIFNVI